MDWLTVLSRIGDGEDARTERGRFRSFSDKDWLKTVCAMANSLGGVVILGVLDDGTIEGVPMDPEPVQERLTSALQTALSQPVRARLGRHQDPSGWVHWIEVDRMRGPQPLSYKGRLWVRRGRASVEPEATELQELYNVFGLVLTEERVIPDTSVDDIDPSAFRTFMARRGVDLDTDVGVSLETDLLNREILAKDFDGALRATLFGVLCFGRAPQDHGPTRNFWIDLVAYAGEDRSDPVVSAAQARGRLDEQVKRAEGWVTALGHQEAYGPLVRESRELVPMAALRECVVNAVAHRDYSILGDRVMVEVFSDRISVLSPGALPNHKTPASVMAGGVPRSRNEAIANTLFDLGLMERRGSGYPRIIKSMRLFNNTAPELETNADERWVRVTLRR